MANKAYKQLYIEQLEVSKYLENQVKKYQYVAFSLALASIPLIAVVTHLLSR